MARMFGRFEVQSELSKSDTAVIYKVMDTETSQVVALKTQSLAPLGKGSDGFVNTLITEGESTRDLVCQNIVQLYGAGEIEGQFCAAMEYIQGNSIASMLVRKDGFSIWDLLDITRQVCSALEHAAAKQVAHCSLEPAKIMVQWDGTVKILGYGISNMSLIAAEAGNGLGRLMPYCSPEQIRGETVNLRSNLFTLGTILYEMVAGRKAFDAEDPVSLLNQIENEMPPNPSAVNGKIQADVSAIIMKALSKDSAERYHSAGEVLVELEKCKEGGKKAAAEVKVATPAPAGALDPAARAGADSKFVKPPSRETKARSAVAAAAGAGSNETSAVDSRFSVPKSEAAAAGAGTRGIKAFDVNAADYQAARKAVMSSALVPVEEPAPRAPGVAVDPMMAQPAPGSTGKSFSDLAEMPPLKSEVFPPSIPEPIGISPETHVYEGAETTKEKKGAAVPREGAQKALRQIVTIPPRLVLFAILGAAGLILAITVAVFFHIRSEDSDVTGVAPANPVTQSSSSPASAIPAPVVATPVDKAAPASVEASAPKLQVRPAWKGNLKGQKHEVVAATLPAVVPGMALIDSTPQGAQFQVDQASDPSWVTPFTLSNLSPGKHIVSVSKAGYTSEIRSVEVVAGGKASLVLHLSPVNALMVVNSSPAAAEVIIDGKPTGRVTPSQFAVEKGSHTVLLRKQGYLDETVTAELGPAQNFQYSPALKALGNVNDMRTVGKLGKLFGRGSDSTAGMGTISVHTQPKGAQVAINQRMLEKLSPADVMLGPGNYIVDITLTGFKPVHKIVNVDKGGKIAVDEILERE